MLKDIKNNKNNKNFKLFDSSIFCFIKPGPITELNSVPGNEPIEKHAKKIPAKDLSNI